MRKSIRRAECRGSVAVEFAIVLPVFVSLLLGVTEYGWLFYTEVIVANAAREGARVGVTLAPGDAVDGPTAAQERAAAYLAASGLSCTGGCAVAASDAGTAPARMLDVEVTYPYQPLIGFVPTPADVVARSSMRYEVQF